MFFSRIVKKLLGICGLFLIVFPNHATNESAFHWQGYYNTDLWYGLQGGLKNKGRYLGKGAINVEINFEKLLNIKKVEGFIEVQNINSQRPNLLINSIEGINSIQGFDNIEYDRLSTMTNLYQFWLKKSSDHWSALIGIYDLNSEFYLTDSSLIFILPAFGTGTDLAQTGRNGPSIFPNPGSALRIKYLPTSTSYIQAAVFDAAATNPLNPAYPHPPFASGLGLLNIVEAAIFLGKDKAKLALGSWLYTKSMHQQELDDSNAEVAYAINKGIYFMIDTPLYNKNNQDIHGFLRYGTATTVINIFNKSLSLGIKLKGFNKKRPDDAFAFAYGFAPAWTSVESRLAKPNLPKVEMQHELTYRIDSH